MEEEVQPRTKAVDVPSCDSHALQGNRSEKEGLGKPSAYVNVCRLWYIGTGVESRASAAASVRSRFWSVEIPARFDVTQESIAMEEKVVPWNRSKSKAPESAEAPVRAEGHAPLSHEVLGGALSGEFAGKERALFAMGCFWGAEKKFWGTKGVVSTAVGYAAGHTANPSYEEVCTGRTGHAEVVRVIFDPRKTSYDEMLRVFWENHDPTQGMRQGNDVGTQYRSGIYWYDENQKLAAEASRKTYQRRLREAGLGEITTEILPAPEFYFAEDYHQQYLAKNPHGYCGLGGTGVSCGVAPEHAGTKTTKTGC
jgi:peptide-methionine (S)-S-oxide reductase